MQGIEQGEKRGEEEWGKHNRFKFYWVYNENTNLLD